MATKESKDSKVQEKPEAFTRKNFLRDLKKAAKK